MKYSIISKLLYILFLLYCFQRQLLFHKILEFYISNLIITNKTIKNCFTYLSQTIGLC